MPNHVTNILTFSGLPAEIKHMMREIQYDDGDFGTIDFNKIIFQPETLNITSGGYQDEALNVYLSSVNPDNENVGIEKLSKDEYNKVLQLVQQHHFRKEDINDKMTYAEIINISTCYFNRADPSGNDTADDHNIFMYGKIIVDNLKLYGCKDWYEWCCRYWGTKWNSYNSPAQDWDSNEIIFDTAWSAPHPVIEKLASKYPNVGIVHKWADEDWGNNTGYMKYNIKEEEMEEPCYLEGQEAIRFSADILGINLEDFYLEHDCCIDIENDFPFSLSEEDYNSWCDKGFDFNKFPNIKKEEDDEYTLHTLTFEEKKAFIEEMYSCKIDINEFFYG